MSSAVYPFRQIGRFKCRLPLTLSKYQICKFPTHNSARFAGTNVATGEWFLSAAVCVERIPTLTPQLTKFQQKMMNHLSEIECEDSKKSEFEVRHEADVEAAEKRKREGTTKLESLTTAEDDHDAWVKERAAFVPAGRTMSYETEDAKSKDRALDRPLHLVIERNAGSMNDKEGTPYFYWDLPSTIREEGEPMRDAAERALKESCGDEITVQVLGNAPWGYFKQKYPKSVQTKTGKVGEKVFIYKAQYKKGDVTLQENISRDYKWSLRNELWDILFEAPDSRKALFEILYEEDDCVD